jgi:predicted dehydrogenase
VEYGFTDLSAFAASGLSVDVASVCAPSEDHGPLLRQLLGIPVKLVFCEKPLTRDLGEGRAVAIEYERAGRLLAVNYTRRWNPSLARLRSEIVEERWGQLITAAGFYTKGVLNNGSHLIDLLRFLVGDLGVVTATARRADWSREEPTVDAVLRTADGAPVHLMGGDARAFHMFELTLVFERGVIALENGGRVLRVRRPAMSNRSPGQIELGVPSTSETEWGEQFLHALDNIHDALTQGVPLASSAKEALAAQAICAELAHCAGSACWVGA